jgi:drug/metabolite transporter (DMT)-like permease
LSASVRGIGWCLVFVILEAIGAVYFGAVFQEQDAFLLGALVFGSTTIGALLYSYLFARHELFVASRSLGLVVGMNVTAAGGWLAYLMSIQYIEPAVAFALFSGSVPLATILVAWKGISEANSMRNALERIGNGVIAVSMLALCLVTIAGYSGFVGGGTARALAGVLLATGSGALIAGMLFYCQRLNVRGLSAMTQFGLRFVLYVLLAAIAAWLGVDRKGEIILEEFVIAVGLGLVLIAFPVYATQRAISLVSALTIGAITALGPLFVFILQFLDERLEYAPVTLFWLCVYFLGALAAAVGAARATKDGRPSAGSR